MQYEFSGKLFRHPEKITCDRVITAYEIEKEGEISWLFNREAIPKMMRVILDGPHDEIDWLQQDIATCKKAYADFFALVSGNPNE